MMKPEEFVEKLKRGAPSLSDLIHEGYSQDEAEEEVALYVCKRRALPLKMDDGKDSFLDLLRAWDLSATSKNLILRPSDSSSAIVTVKRHPNVPISRSNIPSIARFQGRFVAIG